MIRIPFFTILDHFGDPFGLPFPPFGPLWGHKCPSKPLPGGIPEIHHFLVHFWTSQGPAKERFSMVITISNAMSADRHFRHFLDHFWLHFGHFWHPFGLPDRHFEHILAFLRLLCFQHIFETSLFTKCAQNGSQR